MTRVNIGIPPKKLTNLHLLAEHREIKRIPNALKKYGKNLNIKDIPKQFTLGTGHVRFFYDKGIYTFSRYVLIYDECLRRKLNVTYFIDAWAVYNDYKELWNDYIPTEQDIEIIKQRLIERDVKYKQIL